MFMLAEVGCALTWSSLKHPLVNYFFSGANNIAAIKISIMCELDGSHLTDKVWTEGYIKELPIREGVTLADENFR